jgi:inosine/xanthosine triphosphatase
VGIEAGLVTMPGGHAPVDSQACVVHDALGRETVGWGPGFHYPDWVTRRALAGEMVSDILGPVAQDPRIGGTTGAVGFLTDGRMDRTELTRLALLMAFVPRLHRELYDLPMGHGQLQAAPSASFESGTLSPRYTMR